MTFRTLSQEEAEELIVNGSELSESGTIRCAGVLTEDDRFSVRVSGYWHMYRSHLILRTPLSETHSLGELEARALLARSQRYSLDRIGMDMGRPKNVVTSFLTQAVRRAAVLARNVRRCDEASTKMHVECICPECCAHALETLKRHREVHAA